MAKKIKPKGQTFEVKNEVTIGEKVFKKGDSITLKSEKGIAFLKSINKI